MNAQTLISLIHVADAVGDREKALVAVQALRDALDGGLVSLTDGPNAHPQDRQRSSRSKPFPARHTGTCAKCNRAIAVGNVITYSRDDRSAEHVSCEGA